MTRKPDLTIPVPAPYRWLTYPGEMRLSTTLLGPNTMGEYWVMVDASPTPDGRTRCGFVVAPEGYRQG